MSRKFLTYTMVACALSFGLTAGTFAQSASDDAFDVLHMIAGKRRQERSEPSCDVGPVAQNLAGDFGARDHDEVEVGMLVQGPADERAPGREPDETLIGAEPGDRGLQEGAMRGRHVRPVRGVEHVFVSRTHRSVCGRPDRP